MSKNVYLVGHNVKDDEWRLCGIYSSKRVATAVAIDVSKDCFVATVELDSMEFASEEDQGEMEAFYPADLKKKDLMR